MIHTWGLITNYFFVFNAVYVFYIISFCARHLKLAMYEDFDMIRYLFLFSKNLFVKILSYFGTSTCKINFEYKKYKKYLRTQNKTEKSIVFNFSWITGSCIGKNGCKKKFNVRKLKKIKLKWNSKLLLNAIREL